MCNKSLWGWSCCCVHFVGEDMEAGGDWSSLPKMVLLMVPEPRPGAPVVWNLVDNVLCVSFSVGILVYGEHPYPSAFSSRKLVCMERKNLQVQREPGSEAWWQQTTEHGAQGIVPLLCCFHAPLPQSEVWTLGAKMKFATALEELCLLVLLVLNYLVSMWKDRSCMETL